MTIIDIPTIRLEWSDWIKWEDLKVDARRGGIRVPNHISGVYEAKYKETEDRLTIGKASDLRHRVKQGLVKGKTSHSAGEKIRKNEDVSRIEVSWGCTNRPACAEEWLHRKHVKKYQRLPKYVEHT